MMKLLALTDFQGLNLYSSLVLTNPCSSNKKVLLQNRLRTLHQNNEFSTKKTDSPPKYVGLCSSNSLTTRRGTRNLIYILPLFFLICLQLLLTLLLLLFSYFSLLTSSSIVAVLIAKAEHVWVN